jgi:endogenous inhibitor of DNA gyrase (YacG/DUF329 family)
VKKHFQQMPMVVCPACEKEFEWHDYYDAKVDSTRECPNCGAENKIVSMDYIMEVTLEAHQPFPNGGEQIMQVGPVVKGSGDEGKNSRPAPQAGGEQK